MATRPMVTFGQVMEQFMKLPNPREALEQAYPGITSKDGYLQHLKIDPNSGAWMLETPKSVQNHIDLQSATEAAKQMGPRTMGQNNYTGGSGSAMAAPQQAANSKKLSKDEMAKKGKMSVDVGKPTITSMEVGKPTIQSLDVGQPQIQTPKLTPFQASVLPTGGK